MSHAFKVLDLYCCEGGAGYGYHLAGAHVVGVDLNPQPRYPFEFRQQSVLDVPLKYLRRFDLIHASPPCQFGSELQRSNKWRKEHLNLIPETRAMLQASGVPYVIENVRAVREHLVDPVSLFGSMFDNHMVTSTGQRFDLSRERLFETNWGLQAPADPGIRFPIANVFGAHLRNRSAAHGGRKTRDFVGEDKPDLAKQLMGMPWATMAGMSEAVPPSYTRYIGEQFLATRAPAAEFDELFA